MATNGKKRMKKTQAYLLSAALLTGTFACHTSALGATPATARLSPQYRIVVDNVEQTFYSASGSEMHPLVYNGSTYLPRGLHLSPHPCHWRADGQKRKLGPDHTDGFHRRRTDNQPH